MLRVQKDENSGQKLRRARTERKHANSGGKVKPGGRQSAAIGELVVRSAAEATY